MDMDNQSRQNEPDRLSPWPIRIAVYLVLITLAIVSIWLIDTRAMQQIQNQDNPANNLMIEENHEQEVGQTNAIE